MNYLVAVATLAVVGATIFVYAFMTHLENEYENLSNNSIATEIKVLEIEKNLNYISRTTRDIMLGGNFDQNIEKLQKSITTIEDIFVSIETNIPQDDSSPILKEAKTSTMTFLNNSLSRMQSLSKNDIDNGSKAIYAKYKEDLTPFANTSRSAFKKLVEIMIKN